MLPQGIVIAINGMQNMLPHLLGLVAEVLQAVEVPIQKMHHLEVMVVRHIHPLHPLQVKGVR